MRATRTLWLVAGVALAPLAVFILTGGCDGGLLTSDVLDALSTVVATTTDKQDEAAALTATETTATDSLSSADESTTTADDPNASTPEGRPHGPGPMGPQLTDEQRAAIAALKDALDAGEITQDEFCQQVHDIVGDPPCQTPLPPIELTEEQQTQAETIFQQARDQIVSLHATARDQVLALLTEEQQQALTDLEQPPAPPDGQEAPPEPLCPALENSACAQPAQVPLPPCSDQSWEPNDPQRGSPPPDGDPNALPPDGPPQHGPGMMPPQGGPPGQPPMGHGHGCPPVVCLSEETIATLALTDEQVTAIEALHMALETATAEARDAARVAFRALLTDEQLQELDQLPPLPPPGGPCPPR